ncbi:MAG: hypothetical protein MHM6MM_003647 [Cercozoa sp. M6MM]
MQNDEKPDDVWGKTHQEMRSRSDLSVLQEAARSAAEHMSRVIRLPPSLLTTQTETAHTTHAHKAPLSARGDWNSVLRCFLSGRFTVHGAAHRNRTPGLYGKV